MKLERLMKLKPFLISALVIVVTKYQKWVLQDDDLSYRFHIDKKECYEYIKNLNYNYAYLIHNMGCFMPFSTYAKCPNCNTALTGHGISTDRIITIELLNP